MAVRALVVDDYELVRSGVQALLEGTDVEIVGAASNGAEAVEQAAKLRPDVVLLDIRMEPNDGLDALERIKEQMPDQRVVMLSTYDNPTYIARSCALGADDYVLKTCNRDELVGVIHSVLAGDAPSKQGRMYPVMQTMATKAKQIDGDISLTQRESQVLRHLALGLSNKEIGHSLDISVETVKEHVQHLLRKMGITDRTQAAVWAVKKGLV